MSERVLVTGGAGFVGSHLVERLASSHPVVVYDDLSAGRREHVPGGVELVVGDVGDAARLSGVLADLAPTRVYHLAARHYIPACDADPVGTLRINVDGTQVLLEALCGARHRPAVLVFASTAAVYGPGEGPHREDEAPAPIDIYGLSKWFGEELVRGFARREGVPCVIARLFNVYGARETNPHLIPELVAQLGRGAVRLGNLTPARDYVEARDVAEALDRLAAAPGGAVVNVGTGREASVREVAELVGRLSGAPLAIEVDPARVRRVDREHLRADPARLLALPGMRPPRALEDGLAELVRGARGR